MLKSTGQSGAYKYEGNALRNAKDIGIKDNANNELTDTTRDTHRQNGTNTVRTIYVTRHQYNQIDS